MEQQRAQPNLVPQLSIGVMFDAIAANSTNAVHSDFVTLYRHEQNNATVLFLKLIPTTRS